jgi:Ca-activated chloride channel family protein
MVFIIDISGSMASEDKLPLIKDCLLHAAEELEEGDSIGIVTYGSVAAVELEPTGSDRRDIIMDSISGLSTGGSTNAESGLRTGYDLITRNYKEGGINRLILLSDGVANTGISDVDGLISLVEDHSDRGVYLSTFGFGMGVYNDELMEQLADNGDGRYGYIDSLDEGIKEFVTELHKNIVPVAKDLKIRVDLNPDRVTSYRLVGYNNRLMDEREFDDEDKDSGDINVEHTVTALYEIRLKEGHSHELGNITLRYRDPDSFQNREIIQDIPASIIIDDIDGTSAGFRFCQSVAELAEFLMNTSDGQHDLDSLVELAEGSLEDFNFKAGSELEFLELLRRIRDIMKD